MCYIMVFSCFDDNLIMDQYNDKVDITNRKSSKKINPGVYRAINIKPKYVHYLLKVLGIRIFDIFTEGDNGETYRYFVVKYMGFSFKFKTKLADGNIYKISKNSSEYFKHITDTIIGYNYNRTSDYGIKTFVGDTLPPYNYIGRLILIYVIHKTIRNKKLKYASIYGALVY